MAQNILQLNQLLNVQGGLPQVFVPDASQLVEQGILVPVDKITLIK